MRCSICKSIQKTNDIFKNNKKIIIRSIIQNSETVKIKPKFPKCNKSKKSHEIPDISQNSNTEIWKSFWWLNINK